jgi:RimJ/RimL family protein N-acetyltransferase
MGTAVTVKVIACDIQHLTAALEDPAALGRRVGAEVAPELIEEEWLGAFRFACDELVRRPEIFGWWSYLFVLDEPSILCGMGGYKGPPKDGVVEIGYSIAPSLRGRGLATAAARELVRIAFDDPSVVAVQAHTLAEPNASTRVLEKVGLRKIAELIDPAEHDGPIWRWRLDRPTGTGR